MLRYDRQLALVQSPFTTSGQETDRVNSYNPGARTGPLPSVLWHHWLGDRMACKKLAVGLLVVMIWLELCTSYCSSCHQSPPPSSLAPTTSRKETLCYRLNRFVLEHGIKPVPYTVNAVYKSLFNSVIWTHVLLVILSQNKL